jgi:predicted permease
VSQVALLAGNMTGSEVGVPGYTPKGPNDRNVLYHVVAPRFFETWKIPLLLGRDIQWTDRGDSPKVVIVNETFARKFFPDANPIGRQIQVFNLNSDRPPDTTVIGVASDSKYHNVKEERTEPTLYLPFRQQSMRSAAMVVRTQGDPMKLVATIRQEMAAIDSTVPMVDVVTEVEQVNRRIQQERQLTVQLILFGAVALLLCAMGIYGMLAYTVGFRTREIGLRMALGAQRSNVLSMVIRESLIPVAIGIAMGLTAAFALTRLVESMLYGVKPNDPTTIVIAAVVFLVIAAIAAFVPARRASRTEPMSALRYE